MAGGGEIEATNREPEAGEGKTEEAGRLEREFRVPSGRRWARQCSSTGCCGQQRCYVAVVKRWLQGREIETEERGKQGNWR